MLNTKLFINVFYKLDEIFVNSIRSVFGRWLSQNIVILQSIQKKGFFMNNISSTFSSNFNGRKWSLQEENSMVIDMDEYPCEYPPEAVNMKLEDFLPVYCARMWC